MALSLSNPFLHKNLSAPSHSLNTKVIGNQTSQRQQIIRLKPSFTDPQHILSFKFTGEGSSGQQSDEMELQEERYTPAIPRRREGLLQW